MNIIENIKRTFGKASDKTSGKTEITDEQIEALRKEERMRKYKEKVEETRKSNAEKNRKDYETARHYMTDFRPVEKVDKWVKVCSWTKTGNVLGRVNLKDLKTVFESINIYSSESSQDYDYIEHPTSNSYSDCRVNCHRKEFNAHANRIFMSSRGNLILANFAGTNFYMLDDPGVIETMKAALVNLVNFVENGMDEKVVQSRIDGDETGIIDAKILTNEVSEDMHELYSALRTL